MQAGRQAGRHPVTMIHAPNIQVEQQAARTGGGECRIDAGWTVMTSAESSFEVKLCGWMGQQYLSCTAGLRVPSVRRLLDPWLSSKLKDSYKDS